MIRGKRKSPIKDFEHYIIRENGDILPIEYYNSNNGIFNILSKRVDRAGYVTVRLYKESKTYTKYLHRLLAEAFTPNPLDKRFVNHRNGKKTDNSIQNLEFVDHSENIFHAHQNNLIRKCNKEVIDTSSGEIFQSAKEAALIAGINYPTLKNYLNGRRPNQTCLRYKA